MIRNSRFVRLCILITLVVTIDHFTLNKLKRGEDHQHHIPLKLISDAFTYDHGRPNSNNNRNEIAGNEESSSATNTNTPVAEHKYHHGMGADNQVIRLAQLTGSTKGCMRCIVVSLRTGMGIRGSMPLIKSVVMHYDNLRTSGENCFFLSGFASDIEQEESEIKYFATLDFSHRLYLLVYPYSDFKQYKPMTIMGLNGACGEYVVWVDGNLVYEVKGMLPSLDWARREVAITESLPAMASAVMSKVDKTIKDVTGEPQAPRKMCYPGIMVFASHSEGINFMADQWKTCPRTRSCLNTQDPIYTAFAPQRNMSKFELDVVVFDAIFTSLGFDCDFGYEGTIPRFTPLDQRRHPLENRDPCNQNKGADHNPTSTLFSLVEKAGEGKLGIRPEEVQLTIRQSKNGVDGSGRHWNEFAYSSNSPALDWRLLHLVITNYIQECHISPGPPPQLPGRNIQVIPNGHEPLILNGLHQDGTEVIRVDTEVDPVWMTGKRVMAMATNGHEQVKSVFVYCIPCRHTEVQFELVDLARAFVTQKDKDRDRLMVAILFDFELQYARDIINHHHNQDTQEKMRITLAVFEGGSPSHLKVAYFTNFPLINSVMG